MDDRTLLAVTALLEKAEEAGIGIALVPEGDGWRVMHIGLEWPAYSDSEMMVGDLASAYTLEDAARGALRPLAELAGHWERYQGASGT